MQQLINNLLQQNLQSLSVNDSSLIRFIDDLINQAITQQASDIHCEPYQQRYRIRFRIDGLLHEVAQPPLTISAQLVSRIKIMANLDIAERRLPQDGRCQHGHNDIRISTCPTLYGEKIVIRLMSIDKRILAIESLGFTSAQQEIFLAAISQPQGLILITGPTGSGKTMSLYSALQYLNHDDKNIITIEDPVELIIDGINQVAVNRKAQLDFAKALRAFLRQDPDIIMVGEIRDSETATIALRAAQTGHLVLSTLHSNNSHEAITRLISMGIPLYQIMSSVILITAQRLIRKLCNHCKTTTDTNSLIQKKFQLDDGKLLYHAVGCQRCLQGYRGRMALHELLPIKYSLYDHSNEQTMLQQLKQHAITTLQQRAKQILISGESSLTEIQRALCH